MVLAQALDASPIRLYAVYDYWHSNPNFLLARCGVLLILLAVVYAWCRYGLAQKGFSLSSNWDKLRCWFTGCTSNLSTGDFRFCRNAVYPFLQPRWAC